MKKRNLVWALVIVCVMAGAIGICWSVFGVDQISMTQAQVQARIDAKMPHTAKGVTVTSVKLDLSKGDIGLLIDAQTTKLGTLYNMTLSTQGSLRYDGSRGGFYFHPNSLALISISSNGGSVGGKVGQFIDRYVDSPKIVNNKPLIMSEVERFAQKIAFEASERVLEHVPVCTLPDNLTGQTVRVFLKSVEVKDGSLVAHLSLWQFTKWVFFELLALLGALAMTGFMLRNPGWAGAAIVLGGAV